MRWAPGSLGAAPAKGAPPQRDGSLSASRPPGGAPTGACHQDPGFRPHFLKYGADQGAFFADYAAAHKRLSELGAAFFPAGGLRI